MQTSNSSMEQQTELKHVDLNRKFILLNPVYTPPRTESRWFGRICTHRDVPHILRAASRSRVVAVDLETRGSDYSRSDLEIVGIGLSWDTGSCYCPLTSLPRESHNQIVDFLYSHEGLIAHNVYYDGGVLYSKYGEHPRWLACTLATYRHIANEGWAGQSHGLKNAMVDLLLWPESNETELDEWLVTNGYYKGNQLKDNSPENLLRLYQEGKLRPEKGEMWRAPEAILGKYCILDAEATYLLYTQHLEPVLERFQGLREFLQTGLRSLLLQLIEQRMAGIQMDVPGLHHRQEELLQEIQTLENRFRSHGEVFPHITEMEGAMLSELKEPTQYRKLKERGKEPPKYRKNGTLSKVWLNWDEAGRREPEVSKVWLKWHEKYTAALRGELPEYKFNMQSGPQMRELLFDRLGYHTELTTESGLKELSLRTLATMGEIGTILVDYTEKKKELGFIEDYLERTQERDTIHPSFQVPGTKTGRLTSSKPNLQQVPKTHRMMSLFRARPGTVWVDLDFSALEPVVATEFSQDPNMLRIYGDGMPPNDIYLYVGANIDGSISKAIRGTGYDPLNPTAETLAKAKKQCKLERSICKTVTLACQYGAGVRKITETLGANGIHLPEREVATIHSGYWKLFNGLVELRKQLEIDWEYTRGYVLNGMGRPMCVTEDYRKDLFNRFIQSTGHDVLVRYIEIVTSELNLRRIPWTPIVIDWHDAMTIETPEQCRDRVVQVYNESLEVLNDELGWSIKLKGVPTTGYNMAEVKEPEQ